MTDVLIVDDHPSVLFGIQALLELEADLDVCGTADSAELALEMAAATSPDVVVMDIKLTGMDGFTAAERLRRMGSPSRVVMLSAAPPEDVDQRTRDAGAHSFVRKDDGPEALLDAIRAAAAAGRLRQ